MTKAEIMLGAADLLEKRGRTTKQYMDADGRLCLVGAIVLAGGGFFKYDDEEEEGYLPPDDYSAERVSVLAEINETIEYLAMQVPPNSGGSHDGACLTTWNDTDGRTDAEVLDFLRTNAAEVAA